MTSTREQILDAASRLVHVRGFNNTSVDEILRESGVGKGNLYYYFKSKDELGFAILERGLERISTELIEKSFKAGKDPWEQILDFLDFLVDRARRQDCTGGCLLGNLAVEMSDIHEEFRRRTKTQASLPNEAAVVLLMYGLLCTGQIRLNRMVGWKDLPQTNRAVVIAAAA